MNLCIQRKFMMKKQKCIRYSRRIYFFLISSLNVIIFQDKYQRCSIFENSFISTAHSPISSTPLSVADVGYLIIGFPLYRLFIQSFLYFQSNFFNSGISCQETRCFYEAQYQLENKSALISARAVNKNFPCRDGLLPYNVHYARCSDPISPDPGSRRKLRNLGLW